jgi:peptidoglycan/xylan/chitin deacetylase (PgdA/CDA1 family)
MILQEAAFFLIRWSGLAFLVRHTIARRRVSILVYHDPAPAVLEGHFAYLARRYNFISMSSLVEALSSRSWDSLPSRSLVITFDDGHRRNAELLDTFRHHAIVPTIYLCSQIVGTLRHYWFLEAEDPERLKPLSSSERTAALAPSGFEPTNEYPENERQALDISEMRGMARDVEFASHTRFHPILTVSDNEESEREIRDSKVELEELLGQECVHFSYPNGDYSAREIEFLRTSGYASGRTVDLGWNGPDSDAFRLKVLGTEDDASLNRLAADLSGIAGYVARLRVGSFRGRHVPVRKQG